MLKYVEYRNRFYPVDGIWWVSASVVEGLKVKLPNMEIQRYDKSYPEQNEETLKKIVEDISEEIRGFLCSTHSHHFNLSGMLDDIVKRHVYTIETTKKGGKDENN